MRQLDPETIKGLLLKEDPLILEIGAHKGIETMKFLQAFPAVKLYCFEPDPRCIHTFKTVIRDPRCSLIEAAVSDDDGKTILNMSEGHHPGRLNRFYKPLRALGLLKFIQSREVWDFSSSIKRSVSKSPRYPWLTFDRKIEVAVIKLDTWAKREQIKFVDFIWADVQGAEKNLIEGARETLKKTAYFFTEYGEKDTYPEAMTREETIQLLNEHNFELVPNFSSKSKIGNLLFKYRPER